MNEAALASSVVAWQVRHGRHGLPWQNTTDAYRIWLSEIMLQQTQVSAVIGYFQRFLTALPTVQALAAADTEQVLALWSGLGYYTRARNLHKCAKAVVAEHGGKFPDDPMLLAELPGIGRSTAAAIVAFAYGVPSPILDGNVKRVFCRYFAVRGVPSTSKVDAQLWEIAEREMPRDDVRAYTQGLMDLGATVCTRSKPACSTCPLNAKCQALARGLVSELPERKLKKTIPTREVDWVVPIRRWPADGPGKGRLEVQLIRRGSGAVWEGLWAFREQPMVDLGVSPSANAKYLTTIKHSFSHYHLLARIWQIDVIEPKLTLVQGVEEALTPYGASSKRNNVSEEMIWMPSTQWADAALPKPVKAFLLGLKTS